jgi:WD40 repeat protein
VNDHVKLWDLATGVLNGMPGTQQHLAQGVSFSRDGRRLISARSTGIIRIWDIAARRRITTLRAGSGTYCAAFSRDGRFVATGGADTMVRVWDLAPMLGEGSQVGVPNR